MKIKQHIVILFTISLLLTSILLVQASSGLTISSEKLQETSYTHAPVVGATKISTILDNVTEDLLRKYLVPLVAYGPRLTGSYGCEKAAEFIYTEFLSLGLETRYHNWTSFGNEYNRRLFRSQNVEATLPGTNTTSTKLIVFNAHFDSVKVSPGANDDGSGTAAVLAAAAVLSQFSFNHSLRFITFSGEENGLLGSHAYARYAYEQNHDIVVDINADMIGHATTMEGGSQMGITTSEDVIWVLDIADALSIMHNVGLQINRGSINRESRGWSDYHSFIEYGYEAIACWEGEHDPNMHTPNDDLDNVNFSYLVKTTKMIVGLLAYLADYQEFSPQIRIEYPKFGTLYYKDMPRFNISDLTTIVIDDIWVWADIRYNVSPVARVEFYYDDKLAYTDTMYPFKWFFSQRSLRTHKITVIMYDVLGRSSYDFRTIRCINVFKDR